MRDRFVIVPVFVKDETRPDRHGFNYRQKKVYAIEDKKHPVESHHLTGSKNPKWIPNGIVYRSRRLPERYDTLAEAEAAKKKLEGDSQ